MDGGAGFNVAECSEWQEKVKKLYATRTAFYIHGVN